MLYWLKVYRRKRRDIRPDITVEDMFQTMKVMDRRSSFETQHDIDTRYDKGISALLVNVIEFV